MATAHRFIQFLGRYRGEAIGPAALTGVTAADFRAFLADRRAGGLGPSSAARELSGVRAFLKYAAEQQGSVAQLPRTRAPKRPRTLPRPAAPDDVVELAENAAEAASEPWIGARDLAILLLLYGAGLRVAEALSLSADVLPIGSTLKVMGKRSKTRIVPVVAAVREAIDEYARQCPYPLRGAAPLFVGARGGPLNAGPGTPRGCGSKAAAGAARHADSARPAPQLRDASACPRRRSAGRCRSCSVMPACPRPRSIRRSTRHAC